MENFTLPCRAASVRGELKHSYLTNSICLKTQPDRLKVSMTCEENGIPRHNIIRNQIQELLELMGSSENGFSPAQLLDQLSPFQELSERERDLLKAQIHRQFVENFQLAQRQEQLEKTSATFLSELDAFLLQPATKAGMEKVQTTARILIGELENLPKGIWLWKTVSNGKTSS
jgi:hypothetical protein